MQAGTRNIYYLCAPNRHLAEHSPYYEAMKQKHTEVGGLRLAAGSKCERENDCVWGPGGYVVLGTAPSVMWLLFPLGGRWIYS